MAILHNIWEKIVKEHTKKTLRKVFKGQKGELDGTARLLDADPCLHVAFTKTLPGSVLISHFLNRKLKCELFRWLVYRPRMCAQGCLTLTSMSLPFFPDASRAVILTLDYALE